MASRKISELTALTAPASADVLPIVDVSEALPENQNKKITYAELLSSAPAGTAAAPSFAFDGDPDSGVYSAGANQVAISTGGSERLRITSAGNVGIGTANPQHKLEIASGSLCVDGFNDSANTYIALREGFSPSSAGGIGFKAIDHGGANADGLGCYGADGISFYTNAIERARIDSSGRLGIGVTSVSNKLTVRDSNETAIVSTVAIENYITGNPSSGNGVALDFNLNNNSNATVNRGRIAIVNTNYHAESEMRFYTATSNAIQQRMVLDSSGRLLVGTSSSILSYAKIQIQGGLTDQGAHICLANETASPVNGSNIGSIRFTNNAGGIGAIVNAEADGAWTAGSNYRTRLVFSTTADGESSPTERMRITNAGLHYFMANGNDTTRIQNTAAAGTATSFLAAYHSSTAGTVNTGTLSLNITTNGNITNTNNSYGAISDIKLKENIVDANSQWDDLKALQVRKYNFKEGQTHTQIGLIAQEVELVSPGLVSESPDRDADGNDLGTVTKSVNYSVLYMKAVKALQEAMERIETLEAKVAALESA